MSAPQLVFGTYEQLENYLRHFVAFGTNDPREMYDFVGFAYLFAACLDNLRKYALEVQLDDIGDCLSPEQRKFLNWLGNLESVKRTANMDTSD